MSEFKDGIHLPDGEVITREEIEARHKLETSETPTHLTPLPERQNFHEWSERFQRRREEYLETMEAPNDLVEIAFERDIVLNIIGDIHAGSPHVHYERLEQELDTIVNTPNSYVILAGDPVDGFFFRPALFETIEQVPEQIEYMQAMIEYLAEHERVLVGFVGDHEAWMKKMGASAYSEFSEKTGGHLMHGLGYIKLYVGDEEYNISGAHRLPGHSMYNNNHPGMRAVNFGGAGGSDIVFHGHTHRKGYAVKPERRFGGNAHNIHYVSVGPYKETDEYSRKKGWGSFDPVEMYGSAIRLSSDGKKITYHDDILEANRIHFVEHDA